MSRENLIYVGERMNLPTFYWQNILVR